MSRSTTLRRFGRNAFISATALSGVMFGIEAVAAIVPTSGSYPAASAASAGTPPSGAVVLTPTSGSLGTVALGVNPAPAFCPGDSTAGYRWQGFITDSRNDPATLTYDSNGPLAPSGASGVTFPLISGSGSPVVNLNTAAESGQGGQISPIPGINLAAYGTALPDGQYKVGLACSLAGATVRFWTTPVAISAGTFGASTPTTSSSTTTTSTVAGATTTTVVAGTTTTTVAGATTTSTTTVGGASTTTVPGAQAVTLTPAVPAAGASYKVTHPNCRVGDTITVTQPQSTPTSATATCALPVAGLVRPEQAAAPGTATVTFAAAPTTPGSYTVTSTGATSGSRTATFVIVGAASPNVVPTTVASTGGSPSGGSTGSIPSTGSSTTSIIVWGILLLVFGRMTILFGRKPKVISANR